jgi:uncharacterized coiled-coil protein SlyX
MVKNLSTVERSTKIRFGKNCTDDQGENTIVFNASDEQIDTSRSGTVYMTPLRQVNTDQQSILTYDAVTKEVINSGVPASQALNVPSLQQVTDVGNTTTSNVGIANTNPQHLLSVSNTMFVSNTGEYHLKVSGRSYADSMKIGTSVLLNPLDATNQVQVTGQISTSTMRVINRMAIDNTAPTKTFSISDKLFMDKDASNVIQTSRDIDARKYFGDGSSLTGLSLNDIANRNSTTSAGLSLTNGGTALTTTGNIVVGNTLSANALKVNNLSVGFVPIVTDGNVLTDSTIQAPSTGTLRVDADVSIHGNLVTYGNVTQISANNLTVDDPLILVGNHNPLDTSDLGVIMRRATSNVAFGFRGDEEEFMIGYTHSDASGTTLTPLTTTDIDVKVYGNLSAKELNASTIESNVVADNVVASHIFGPLEGANTISASTVSALTTESNLVADNVVASHIFGPLEGANTISASTVSALTMESNVIADNVVASHIFGPLEGANTISASTVSALTTESNVVADNVVASHIFGPIEGANTISASTVTALTTESNVVADNVVASHIFGPLEGANTISASTITALTTESNVVADNVVASHIFGPIEGANTISASTVTALTTESNLVADNVVASHIFGPIEGANTISASTVTALTTESNVVADNVVASHIFGPIEGANTISATIVTSLTTESNVIADNVVASHISANVITATNVNTQNVLANIVTANLFFGDGGFLSNIAANLQDITVNGNVTDQVVQFTNPTTAFTTDLTANVLVNLTQLNDVTLTAPSVDQVLMHDGSNWTNQYPNHNFVRVKNISTTTTLTKGTVVYVAGPHNQNLLDVAPANASNSTEMPAIGVVYADISAESEGFVVAYGRAQGINVNGFIEGEVVYVSNTLAGRVSNVKPLGPTDGIQNIGIVTKSGTAGTVFVTGVGRTNDIPNAQVVTAQPDYVYVNTTGNELKKIAPSNLLTKYQTLEQVVNTGNTVANTIQVTGLTTTGDLNVGNNIFVQGIETGYFPIVGPDKKLIQSTIHNTNGTTTITNDVEISGNLLVTGNSYIVESTSVVIEDRILGIAANNVSHTTDIGLIFQHPEANVAFIHHGEGGAVHEHYVSLGYTQNTITDEHIEHDLSNVITFQVYGNVIGQNNITVVNGSYFGDGTKLNGVALSTDLTSNVARIINLESNLVANSQRISNLNSNLVANAVRITNLESNLVANSQRISNLDSNLIANAVRITNLESNLVANSQRISNLDSNLVANAVRITNLESNLVANSQRISNLDSNLIANAVRITNLESNLVANSQRISNLDSNLVANAVRITNLESNLVANSQRISNLDSNLVANAVRITNLESNLVANSQRISNLDSNLIANAVRITNLESNLIANSQRISNLDSNLVANAVRITNLESNLVANSLRISNLDSNLVANAVRITNLESNLVANSLRITNLNSNLIANSQRITTLENTMILKAPLLDPVFTNNVTVSGNLTVLGTTTTVNTENLLVKDPIITVSNAAAAVDAGLLINRPTSNNVFAGFDASAGEYTVGYTDNSGTDAVITVKDNVDFVANVHGNVHANYFIGDGSLLTGVVTDGGGGASNLQEVTDLGNVTSNVVQFTNTDTSLVASGDIEAKNIQLNDPSITTTFASGMLTIDAANKTYGTGSLITLTQNMTDLSYSNLIEGSQVIIPITSSIGNYTVSNTMSNVDYHVYSDVATISAGNQGLMTVSNLNGNVYMNMLPFQDLPTGSGGGGSSGYVSGDLTVTGGLTITDLDVTASVTGNVITLDGGEQNLRGQPTLGRE